MYRAEVETSNRFIQLGPRPERTRTAAAGLEPVSHSLVGMTS